MRHRTTLGVILLIVFAAAGISHAQQSAAPGAVIVASESRVGSPEFLAAMKTRGRAGTGGGGGNGQNNLGKAPGGGLVSLEVIRAIHGGGPSV